MGPVTSGISYMRLRELLESGFTSRAARFRPRRELRQLPLNRFPKSQEPQEMAVIKISDL